MASGLKKKNKTVTMKTRIFIPILLVVLFQLLTFTVVLIFGGEFRSIRKYAYNTLIEKTENRSTYVRNEFQHKTGYVQECAEEINKAVAELLAQRGVSIDQLQTDKDLAYDIIEADAEIVTELLRRASVNDVYLILETGDLYADEGGNTAKPALYLRNPDSDTSVWNGELLLALGFSALSEDPGFTRSSNWSPYFTPNPQDMANFGFYYRTIQTAQENSDLALKDLGYWSGFSEAASGFMPSMKYSLPLIAEDGTVYGILGVGLSENTVLSNMPAYDFLSETACYVLGYSESGGNFDILAYSGSAYDTLLGSADTLNVVRKVETGIYSFESISDTRLTGSVQYIDMYDLGSPYMEEQWALISVADDSSVLYPLLFLRQMLVISALISLFVAAVVSVLSYSKLIKPISNASKLMKTKRNNNEVLRFQRSHIYEIDEMTDAITQLQINIQGFSSQVSKMISIADVGLGTFLYDCTDDSVFVGQSLIKVLQLDLPKVEDILMSRQEFLNSIQDLEIRIPISAGLELAKCETPEDYSKVYPINRSSGETLWMRLGYTYSPNTVIGIVQDITDTIVEKKRIEHERDYDVLTGLLTRQAYYRRIAKLFHNRDDLKTTAFIMVDLDNLKYANDTFGHNFGDNYIKTAADVLKKFENYGGIVSHLSGDEFCICLPGFDSKDEIRKIIASIHADLMQSSCLLADGTQINVSGSMGISWYPDDADSQERLMKYADFAMYTIKHSTKGGVAEFDIKSYLKDSSNLTDR